MKFFVCATSIIPSGHVYLMRMEHVVSKNLQ